MMDKEDAEQLKLLNEAVEAVIEARTAWLNARMPKYARYKIGETLYDLETGRRLGEVSAYDRYKANHNILHDTSMSIEYELRKSENIYDNTSRYGGAIRIGNKAQLERGR